METRTKIAIGVGAAALLGFVVLRSRGASESSEAPAEESSYLGAGAYSVPYGVGVNTPSAGTLDGTTVAGAGLNMGEIFAQQIASENRQLASAERIAARNAATSAFDSVISRGEDTRGREGGRSRFLVNLRFDSPEGGWSRLRGQFVEDLKPLAPVKYPAPVNIPQGAPIKIKVKSGLF